jgi:magnesium and cobalt exporter, CNNM family
MDPVWIEAIGILFLIALIGFFSACEVAIVSTRKSRMQELADEGNRSASIVIQFQNNPEKFLATIHVGVVSSLTLASGLAGAMGFEHLVPSLQTSGVTWIREGSNWISLAIIVAGIGSLVVVFGELVPKSLSLRFAERVALRVAQPLSVFAAIFKYPVKLLTVASNVFLFPFKDKTSFMESRITEEEFKLMLEEGTKSGIIDKTEHELIESIFEFTDTTAKEVMIPRPDVVALNINTGRDKIIKIVLEEGYSRMPVYKDTIDNIIGVVYTKDLLGLLEYSEVIIIEDIIRPAFFIPETKRISQLMRELQQKKQHLAIVIDEFGGTEGIVTMEDILEEIVGEIHDEYDEELKDVESVADGAFLVNARISVKDFNERFNASIPEADEYDTISGFLNKIAGRIPDLNEELKTERVSFTIVKKSQRRIRQVRVKVIPLPSDGRMAPNVQKN